MHWKTAVRCGLQKMPEGRAESSWMRPDIFIQKVSVEFQKKPQSNQNLWEIGMLELDVIWQNDFNDLGTDVLKTGLQTVILRKKTLFVPNLVQK